MFSLGLYKKACFHDDGGRFAAGKSKTRDPRPICRGWQVVGAEHGPERAGWAKGLSAPGDLVTLHFPALYSPVYPSLEVFRISRQRHTQVQKSDRHKHVSLRAGLCATRSKRIVIVALLHP